jgi:hypothetical protein
MQRFWEFCCDLSDIAVNEMLAEEEECVNHTRVASSRKVAAKR